MNYKGRNIVTHEERKFYTVIFGSLLIGIVLAPFVPHYIIHIKSFLISFKHFCQIHPTMSYALYSIVFGVILFLGLPLTISSMLLAGITYKFWEATLLITMCRMLVAISAFIIARHMFEDTHKQKRKHKIKPKFIKKFNEHPTIGLFLMRLSPLPDNAVNYAMGSSSIRGKDYIIVSMITIIPFSILWVSVGNALGSVSGLIRFLN
jgi:uncharacterized membrane protein YdjX (TVP38/TMEM64 family)